MENNITNFIQILKQQQPYLRNNYKVKTLGIFGSYVHNEQRSESDIDLLVSFFEPPGLLKFIELENYLSDLLSIRVDLVMKDSLKPHIGKHILKEVVPL